MLNNNQQSIQEPQIENIQGTNEEKKNEKILKGFSKQTNEVHIKSNELNNSNIVSNEKAKKPSISQIRSNSKVQDNYVDNSDKTVDGDDDRNHMNGDINQSNYSKRKPSFYNQNKSQVKNKEGQTTNANHVSGNLDAQNISKVSQKEENQEANYHNPGSKNNTESISTSQSQIRSKNYKQSNHTENTSLDSTKVSLNGSTVTHKDELWNSQEEYAIIDKQIRWIKSLDIKKRADEEEKIITYLIQNNNTSQQNVLSSTWASEFSENIKKKIITEKPVNNEGLVDANGNLKEGLQANKDYVLISDQVWYYLFQLYGGGPHIILDNTDPSKLKKLLFRPFRLENNSNYCYMNACLQSILSIGELNTYFFDKLYLELQNQQTKKPPKFTNAYYDLLIRFSKSQFNKIISPSLFKSYSQQNFDPSEQHDAQEYLRFVLGEIQDELNFPLPQKRPTEFKDSQQASKFYFKYHTSIVDRLFCGQLISKVQCQKCKYISSTFDPFLDLSLPIESKSLKDLNSCMDLFFKPEEIDGEYKCEKCTKTSRAIKSCQLGNIPKYLVIHLKRFKMFPYKTKIKQHISYPQILDIQKYYASTEKESTKYQLNGVIMHQGSADIGHYVSFNKRQDNKWYYCDDDSIQDCSYKDALDQEAYLLFYEKM